MARAARDAFFSGVSTLTMWQSCSTPARCSGRNAFGVIEPRVAMEADGPADGLHGITARHPDDPEPVPHLPEVNVDVVIGAVEALIKLNGRPFGHWLHLVARAP
jgi:hypothetical protein